MCPTFPRRPPKFGALWINLVTMEIDAEELEMLTRALEKVIEQSDYKACALHVRSHPRTRDVSFRPPDLQRHVPSRSTGVAERHVALFPEREAAGRMFVCVSPNIFVVFSDREVLLTLRVRLPASFQATQTVWASN